MSQKILKGQAIGDKIIVLADPEQDKDEFGIIIPGNAREKQSSGVVISAGPGTMRPLQVKEGDKVIFGKNAGNPIIIDGSQYLVMGERDLIYKI